MSALLPTAGGVAMRCSAGLRLLFAFLVLGTATQPRLLAQCTLTKTTYPVSATPTSVAVGDVNGDKIPDIVTGNNPTTGNAISVLLGKAGGGFASATNYVPNANSEYLSRSVAVGDVNGDGLDDIIFTYSIRFNSTNNEIGVLLAKPGGGFGDLMPYDNGVDTGPIAIATADLNGDGLSDIITNNITPGNSYDNVSVLLAQASGGFTYPTSYRNGIGFPTGLAVGDVNGDKIPDVITTYDRGSGYGVLLVQTNAGAGTLSSATSYSSGLFAATGVTLGDVNDDSVVDIVVAGRGDVYVLPGTGGGNFGSPTRYTNFTASSVAVGDINADGKADILGVSASNNSIVVLPGTGKGNFGPVSSYPVGTAPVAILAKDINGDGKADIIIANSGSNDVTVLVSTPSVAITRQPVSGSAVYAGSNVSTSVSTSGTVGSYQWYKNGTALSAQTSATLTLTSVQPSDAGSYQVVISGCNSMTSTPFSLTVTAATSTMSLSVLYRDADYGNTQDAIIRPYLQLANAGNQAIPYSEITVRYWFTSEGNAPPTDLTVYYAPLGAVSMKYLALAQPRQGALGYVEYSFPGGGSLPAGGNSGSIENGIQKTDRSAFNESDDYSYMANYASFVPNTHITAYRNGVLVWGQEPPIVPMQTVVKVYSVAKDSPITSQIQTRIEVRNEGNTAINVHDLTVRYYFTSDNGQPVRAYVDYAAIGASNIQAKVVQLAAPINGADSYVELQVIPTSLVLAPQSSLGAIDVRLVRSDYGLLNQTNDYSYAATYSNVGLNPRITAYLNGTLVYGTAPTGSSARQAAPESTSSLTARLLGNPVVGGQAVVEVQGIEGQPLQLELRNVQGRVIGQQQIETAGQVERQAVSLDQQPAGWYLLQVRSGRQQQLLKVIKP